MPDKVKPCRYSQQVEWLGRQSASLFGRVISQGPSEELWNLFEELTHKADVELNPEAADGVRKQLCNLIDQLPFTDDEAAEWGLDLLCRIEHDRLRNAFGLPLAEQAQICLSLAERYKQRGLADKALRWAYEACQRGKTCLDPEGTITARDARLLVEHLGGQPPLL